MQKTIVLAFLLVIGCAFTSQAVVIHWAVTTPVDGALTAELFYVAPPPPFGTGAYTSIGLAEALPTFTVGAQATTFEGAVVGGRYVIMLFKDGYYAVSTSHLTYDDKLNGLTHADAITTDSRYPAQGLFNPNEFSGWIAVPEPSAAMLLCIGAAAAVLRRRKRV